MSAVMKAYFPTEDLANRADARLGINFRTETPRHVTPVQGRSWLLEITLPQSNMAQFPNSAFSGEVVGVVLTYDGVVHSQDQP
jgi:hypothetical protein